MMNDKQQCHSIKVKVVSLERNNIDSKKNLNKNAKSESKTNLLNKTSNAMNQIIKYLLYFLVFFLPIFILPFSTEIYEFNKSLLLFSVSSFTFLIWIVKMVAVDRKIEIAKTPLNTPIVAFVIILSISTIFSVDKVSSILGFYGRFSDSLTVYLSLAMLYFVLVNCVTTSYSSRSKQLAKEEMSEHLAYQDSKKIINNILKAFLMSSFIVVFVSLLYSFGFKFIPFSEAQFKSFNLVGGSLNILGIYIFSVILIALYYRGTTSSIIHKHSMSILIILSFVLLAIIDFISVWIIIFVSLVAALALIFAIGSTNRFAMSFAGIRASLLIILLSVVFIASSLSFINKDADSNLSSSAISAFIRNRLAHSQNSHTPINERFIREIVLDKSTAAFVAVESLRKDLGFGIIGSGPGTYLYNFSKFKPAEFNNNTFWRLRFDKAGSEILEKVSTLGILGVLSYLLIAISTISMFIFKSAKTMKKNINTKQNVNVLTKENQKQNKTAFKDSLFSITSRQALKDLNFVYIFAAWFGLLLFQFLYMESTATKFIFWLFTAILSAQYCLYNASLARVLRERKHVFGFTADLKKEDSGFYTSLAVLVAIFILTTISYYYQFRFYSAEAMYKNILLRQNEVSRNSNLQKDQISSFIEKNIADSKKAIEKNPYRGNYKIYLSDIYLNKIDIILRQKTEKVEKDKKKIASIIKEAISYAKSASDSNPNSITFQQKLGDIYAFLAKNMGIAGASKQAIIRYERAAKLEPTNPILHTELGKAYMLDKKMELAINEFKKALEIKRDYKDAALQLGLSYELLGNNQKAISALSSTGSIEKIDTMIRSKQTINLTDITVDLDIAFQLGRIYYNEKELRLAKDIFSKIIAVNPKHSNAHYSLGLIYEQDKNNKKAMKEFELVLNMNPNNPDVKKKVNEIKKTIDKKRKVKNFQLPDKEKTENKQ